MTVVASLEAIALAAVVWFFLRHLATINAAQVDERRELENRIQRPEVLPVQPSQPFGFPDSEPDEIGLVGSITYKDDYAEQEP